MLNLSFQELIFRVIPEEFLFIFAVYVFSHTAISFKKYIQSSVLFIFIVYLIRLLPIQYGVHSILNIIALIILTASLNKIDVIKSIRSSIIVFILGFICEGINVFILQYIMKVDVGQVFSNLNLKIVYGFPSLLIFGIIVLLYYFKIFKKSKLRLN